MPTSLELLTLALAQVDRQIVDLTATPHVTTSLDGESVSWTQHLDMLLRQRETLFQALLRAGGPYEVRSRAY